MLIRPKVYATAAAVALAATAVLLASGPAVQASTSACGGACFSPLNDSSGETLAAGTGTSVSPGGVSCKTLTLAAYTSGCNYPVVESAVNTTSSTEDWDPMEENSVTAFASDDLLSDKLGLLYSGSEVYEYEYAPDGVPSDFCLGAFSSTTTNEETGVTTTTNSVDLQQCGQGAGTLWIADSNTVLDGNYPGYDDLITGTDDAFSDPLVLTVSGSSLTIAPLSELGAAISSTQLWSLSSSAEDAIKKAAADK